MLDLDLEVAAACVPLDQQWVGTGSESKKEEGWGAAGRLRGKDGVLLPAWMKHCGTVPGGHRASLDEEDGAGGKNG